jgi:hypothetical protein
MARKEFGRSFISNIADIGAAAAGTYLGGRGAGDPATAANAQQQVSTMRGDLATQGLFGDLGGKTGANNPNVRQFGV